MTCGDTQDQFVDPTIGSLWTATVLDEAMIVYLAPAPNGGNTGVALVVCDGIPLAGSWTYFGPPFEISFNFSAPTLGGASAMSGGLNDPATDLTCSDGKVTAMILDAGTPGGSDPGVTFTRVA
jgi:hypothetical protein